MTSQRLDNSSRPRGSLLQKVRFLRIVAVLLPGLWVVSTVGAAPERPPQATNPFVDESNVLAPFTRDGLVNLPRISEGIGGVAWLDFNNDNYLDLFIANGAGNPNALFRNNRDGTFTDVAAAAGVNDTEGHSGVATADIDNDGCTDIFVTGEGNAVGIADFVFGETPSRLYLNNCDSTFSNITASAGIPSLTGGLGSAFGDVNNDGYVDLVIAVPNVSEVAKTRKNRLFLNNRNRSFTEITAMAGSGFNVAAMGACLVGFNDYDRDGWTDIYIANCADLDLTVLPRVAFLARPWQLLRNNRDLTFTDIAPQVGLVENGFFMSFAMGDIDNDGDFDLFGTNLGPRVPPPPGWLQSLWKMDANGQYVEKGAKAGLAEWEFGFGASFADVDNDGDEDLFYAGSLAASPFRLIGPGVGSPGRLFVNDGTGRFAMTAAYGQESKFTSGVAAGDYDNNGFPDIVVVSTTIPGQPGTPLLLRNMGNENNWLTVKLVGVQSNKGGVGARIEVKAMGKDMVKEVRAGSSFISTDTPWPTFGLGRAKRAFVKVTWPSGRTEHFRSFKANQMITLIEGMGTPNNN